jgi:DNA-binding transcriptional MerR regulator
MDDEPIEVFYKEENRKYYTIDDVSNILELEQSRIIFYFEKLNDFLNITSIGMYQVFEQEDIDNLRKIKELNMYLGMDTNEIRKYLNSHKQEVLFHKEKQEIDISNQSFADFLIRVLNSQNQMLNQQNEKIEKLIEHGNKTLEIINTMHNNQIDLSNEIKEIKEEMSITQELNSKMDSLKQSMEQRKKEYEEQNQHQGLFSRLFGKKN